MSKQDWFLGAAVGALLILTAVTAGPWYQWATAIGGAVLFVAYALLERAYQRRRWAVALESKDPVTALAMIDFMNGCGRRDRKELAAFLMRLYEAEKAGVPGPVVADEAPAVFHRMTEAIEPPVED